MSLTDLGFRPRPKGAWDHGGVAAMQALTTAAPLLTVPTVRTGKGSTPTQVSSVGVCAAPQLSSGSSTGPRAQRWTPGHHLPEAVGLGPCRLKQVAWASN